MTSTGYRMKGMAKNIERLERDNALLRLQIAQTETLPRIAARARQLGLGPANRQNYLTLTDSPWPAPTVATVARPPETLPEEPLPQPMEPNLGLSLPSLVEFWEEVKTQVEAWVGQP